MNLKTCESCGVVVDLDAFKEVETEEDLNRPLVWLKNEWARDEFFCPCCNKMVGVLEH